MEYAIEHKLKFSMILQHYISQLIISDLCVEMGVTETPCENGTGEKSKTNSDKVRISIRCQCHVCILSLFDTRKESLRELFDFRGLRGPITPSRGAHGKIKFVTGMKSPRVDDSLHRKAIPNAPIQYILGIQR
jgi:hypothetical protein